MYSEANCPLAIGRCRVFFKKINLHYNLKLTAGSNLVCWTVARALTAGSRAGVWD